MRSNFHCKGRVESFQGRVALGTFLEHLVIVLAYVDLIRVKQAFLSEEDIGKISVERICIFTVLELELHVIECPVSRTNVTRTD